MATESYVAPGLTGPVPPTDRSRNGTRRKRTSFSKDHVELLKAAFQSNPYPGISVRESLSQATGLPESRIQVWFQNRRARTLKGKGARSAPWQAEAGAAHSQMCPPGPAAFPFGLGTGFQSVGPCPSGLAFLQQGCPPVKEEARQELCWLPTCASTPAAPCSKQPRLCDPALQPQCTGPWSSSVQLPASQAFYTYPEPPSMAAPAFTGTPAHTSSPASPDSGYWELWHSSTSPPSQYSPYPGQSGTTVKEPVMEVQQKQEQLPDLVSNALEELLGDLHSEWWAGDSTPEHLFSC